MAARLYDFFRGSPTEKETQITTHIPPVGEQGTITVKRLVSDISQATSLLRRRGGSLAALESRISYYLSKGHHVQLAMWTFLGGTDRHACHGQREIPCANNFRQGAFPRITTSGDSVPDFVEPVRAGYGFPR